MDTGIQIRRAKPDLIPKNHKDQQSQQKATSHEQLSTDVGKFLLCRQCLQVITHPSLKIMINGAHEHTFANPHGIVFEIGCFKSAVGCGYIGEPSGDFTWFSGFKWQVAVCAACLTHMGWLFTSPGMGSFHGLILDRLAESGGI